MIIRPIVRNVTRAIAYSITGGPGAIIPVVPGYEPLWFASKFTVKPQDSNGYTIQAVPTGVSVRYVDQTLGNDGTAIAYNSASFVDPLLPTSPLAYATFGAAFSATASGDWLLMKYGEEEVLSAGEYILPNGSDNDHKTTVGAYGTIAARPHLKIANSSKSFYRTGSASNLSWFSLDIHAFETDPDDAGYIPSGTTARIGLGFVSSLMSNIAIEDCIIRQFHTNVSLESATSLPVGQEHSNIQVRKSFILNAHPSGSGHSQGMWARDCSILLEGNLFDHNGWLTTGTIFNHNTYFTGSRYTVIRDNVFLRASSIQNKFTSNSKLTQILHSTLTATLSGAAETTVTFDDLIDDRFGDTGVVGLTLASGTKITVPYTANTDFTVTIAARDFTGDNAVSGSACLVYNTGQTTLPSSLTGAAVTSAVSGYSYHGIDPTGTITITLDSSATITIPYTSVVLDYDGGTATYTFASTDFSSDNAAGGNSILNDDLQNVLLSYDVAIYGNSYSEGEIVGSIGGNDSNGNGTRYARFAINDNVSQFIGRSQPTNRTLGYGYDVDDHEDSNCSANHLLHTDNALVVGRNGIRLLNYATGDTVEDNILYLSGGSISDGTGTNQSGNTVQNNTIDAPASFYLDELRTVEGYLTAQAETATLDSLSTIIQTRSKANPLPLYEASAINDWTKAGYVGVEDIVLVTDIAAATYSGGTHSVAVEFYSPYAITYNWYVGGVLDGTNTTATYSGTSLTGDFSLKCDGVANGTTVSSSTVTITEDAGNITFDGIDDYASFTKVNLSVDFDLRFDFKTSSTGVEYVLGNTSTSADQVLVANNKLQMRLDGNFVQFNIGSIADNVWRSIKLTSVSGVLNCRVNDTTDYSEFNGETDDGTGTDFNLVAARDGPSNFAAISVRSLYFVSEGVKYDMTSGGTPEAASIGSGTMTYFGGAWA
tara:strand:+ start:11101 stop:13911 length:2811 start_codon:yes stop_codon:yes gene_type:complete